MSIDVSSLGPSIVLKWASGMQNVQSIIASIGTASNYLQAAAFTALSVVWVLQQCVCNPLSSNGLSGFPVNSFFLVLLY